MNKYVFLFLLLVLSHALPIKAQNNEIFTLYRMVPNYYNPAKSGEVDFIRINGGAFLPYLGKHGSLKDFLVIADSPFKIGGGEIGVGITVNSISFDLFRNLSVEAQGSFKFRFLNGTFSVGLEAGYFHSNFKGSELVQSNDDNIDSEKENLKEHDYELPTKDVSGGTFDISFGINYSKEIFYIGLSAKHLTNPKLKLSEESGNSTDFRYVNSALPTVLYLESGGNIPLKSTLFSLQPSVLLRTNFFDFHALIEMCGVYKNFITFGIDYRYNEAVGLILGVSYKNFQIGYNWEYDYTSNGKKTAGNHELVIGYRFKLNFKERNRFRQRSIRIM